MKKESLLHKTNLFIRSAIFSFLMITYIILQSFISILFCWCPLKFRYNLITNFTRLMLWSLKILCRINYEIEGLENIPKDTNGIILSKHQSTWETFFLASRFQPAIILKRELLWVPFFGWGLATISPIAINRGDGKSAMQQIISKGKKCLAAGRWILVFPEGTRIAVGKVGKYKLGGARLAVAADYPILPVAHNAGYFWPKRKFIKRPGTVKVVFGPLIYPEGRTAEELTQIAQDWIETTVTRIGS